MSDFVCHWTTWYKLLERGSVRTLRLARALFEVVNNALPMETLNLVIDDTLIPRQSEKTPGSTIRHDHAKRNNRPQFLLAQYWVTLGVSVLGSAGRKVVLPIVSRSVPTNGCSMPGSCERAWYCRCCRERCRSSVKHGAILHYSCHQTLCSSLDADDPIFAGSK
ncbi:MAG: transposase [Nitrosomonas sp.]|nr:transposase [Nitrosomonas sp.]